MAQKRPTTRRARQQASRSKKSQSIVVESVNQPTIVTSTVLPSIVVLSKQALQTVWFHKRLFGGIAIMYGLLTIVLVTGIGAAYDIGAIRDQFGNKYIGSLAAYTQLVINPTGASNAGSGVYQFMLLLIVSLALIWSLRQVYAGHHVTVKDAYYRSMYPLIPCVLVVGVICLQLFPMIVGSALYQAVINNKIAVSSTEVLVWGVAALLLSAVSLYFITASVFGFYVATLPDMTPLKALRLAKQLVTGRRWQVLRKLLFLPIILLLAAALILLPLIVLVPLIAGICAVVLGPLVVVLAHSYVYSLYRGLMDEQTT